MNPQITPEIASALREQPTGPIQFAGEADGTPVFLVRLDDLANLQELVDGRIRAALSVADADIQAERVSDWDPKSIKERAAALLSQSPK